jgi:hypothetical protein
LKDILKIDASKGFGFAWDRFLDLVCAREAEHERAVMDPPTIRRVLERLACVARATTSGTGPLSGIDLAEAYRAETGDAAGEGVLMQLQRLPGLTPREQDPSGRSFVDQDLLAALQGSAVARAIAENSTDLVARRWLGGLSRDGVRMAAHILRAKGFDAVTVLVTAARLCRDSKEGLAENQLAADATVIAIELAREEGGIDAKGIVLDGVEFEELDLEDAYVQNLTIVNSVINTLTVGPGLGSSSVLVKNTTICRVNGVSSEKGLPADVFFRGLRHG